MRLPPMRPYDMGVASWSEITRRSGRWSMALKRLAEKCGMEMRLCAQLYVKTQRSRLG